MDIINILKSINVPVLLIGPPGIGKSESVKEFAMLDALEKGYTEIFDGTNFDPNKKYFVEYDERYYDIIIKNRKNFYVFMDIRIVEYEPTDISGIPQREGDHFKFLPPSWVKVMSEGDGLLFFDEITNVSRPDQLAALYKLLYDKQAGFLKFSKGVKIVAAGNDPSTSSIANNLPLPLISRMAVVFVDPPTIDEWIMYMNRHYKQWNKSIAGFLSHPSFRKYFIKIPPSQETLEPFPTPRTWTLAAIHDEKYMKYFVGKEAAEAYERYKEYAKSLPSIDDLIKDNTLYDKVPNDAKYIVAVGVATVFDERKSSEIVDLINYIANKDADLVVLIVRLITDQRTLSEIIKANPKKYKRILSVFEKLGEYK